MATFNGTAGNDFYSGTSGDDSIYGFAGSDRLIGGGGNDYIDGGDDDDYLTGGFGDDILIGGNGLDRAGWYQTNAALGGVTVSLQLQGTAQYTGAQGWDTLIGIEHLSGTPFADALTGDDGDNWLWGSASSIDPVNGIVSTTNHDTIDGAGGNDLIGVGIGNHAINGGTGIDTLYFTENFSNDPAVRINLALQGSAQDTWQGNWTIVNVENLSGGTGNDELTGDSGANVLAGYVGNDNLVGGGGNDTLLGDGRIFANTTPNGGGSGAIETIEDAASIGAASGDDVLEGGLGDDIIKGGGGRDTASYVNALGSVTVGLYNGGSGEAFGADGYDQLSSIENVIGSAFNDVLFGNDQDNSLSGGSGNDTLRGNAGNDEMYGGDGNDFLGNGAGDDLLDGGAGFDRVSNYTGATSGVTVDLRLQGVAQNTGQGMDTLVNIEHVSGTLFADTLTGDDGDNWLWGSASTLTDGSVVGGNDDTIDGQGGNDLIAVGIGNHVLNGGTGIDTLSFTENQSSDPNVVISLALQGASQVTGNGSWTVTNFENLSGGTGNDSLTGDDLNNVLAGYLGADTLVGGGGNDTLYGDGIITVDSRPTGGSGPIVTFATETAYDPSLVGGDDILEGGLGDDIINGGGGRDTASYVNALGSVTVGLYNGGSGEAFGADGYDQLSSIENVVGSSFNDVIFGNNEDNVLWGGGGNDSLRGNAGNDQVYGGDGNDFLANGAGDDLLDGGAGFDRVSNFNGATAGVTVDLRLQGVAQNTGQGMDTLVNIEHVSGTLFADTLTGDEGDNWLWGSAVGLADGTAVTGNDDTIDGQGGNDLIGVGIGNHVVNGGTGIDTLYFTENQNNDPSVTISLALQGVSQLTGNGSWTITNVENLSGGTGNDALTGDDLNNVLAGYLGADTLVGGGGNDTLYGDGLITVDSRPTGGSGPIVTFATETDYDPSLVGGDDILEGGLGNDVINGGGGLDTATYINAGGSVNVNLGTGFASGADGNDSLISIENAIGSSFNDTINGSAGNNVLDGAGGNDIIQGQDGNDTIHGGDGDDTLRGDAAETVIHFGGNDTLYGGNGNDNLRGGIGDDLLFGGANNDLLRGNGGVDYYDGGSDDGEGVNGIGDRVSFFDARATQGAVADLRTGIISNDGFGNVETMVNIESLGADTAYVDTFYGNESRNFIGASLGDYIYGFGGDDRFQMGAAVALIDGGTGTDTLGLDISGGWLLPDANADGLAESAAAATNGWTVNLSAGTLVDGYGNIGSIIGVENVNGSLLDDTLVGDDGVNVLNGFDGNDILEGRGANDMLDGGNGVDTASYANASSGVTVNLASGASSGADGNDTLISIENVIGSAFIDSLTGNAGDNRLDGGAGRDFLRGNGGNDQLYGGNDDDFLFGGLGDDLIDGGAGFDRATYFTGAVTGVTVDLRIQGVAQNTGSQGMDTLVNIEHVSGTTFADTLTGNDGDNWIWGSVATLPDGTVGTTNNDVLDGQGGNDLLVVGIGNHAVIGGAGTDTLSFTENGAVESGVTVSLALQGAAQATGAGNWTLSQIENLSGGLGNDSLSGDGNANVIAGYLGDDVLAGGSGNDQLYGDGFFGADSGNTGASGPIRFYADATEADPTAVDGNDVLEGGLGNDLINGGGGIDTASYANASGSVSVNLTAAGGTASGADGSDTLVSIENILGSGFNDVLAGNAGDNVISGGDGNDNLIGRLGNDTLLGGNGNDFLRGEDGDDILDGGAGIDRLSFAVFGGGAVGVTVDLNIQGVAQNTGHGMDTLIGIEHVSGTIYNDVITGNGDDNWLWGGSNGTGVTGNDTISGGGGNDLIEVGTGTHTLNGGTGVDTLSLRGNGTDITADGITFDMTRQGIAQNTEQGVMIATGFENVSGSQFDDSIVGDANANVLLGDAGNDTLRGGDGNDTLYGDGRIAIDTGGTGGSGGIVLLSDVAASVGLVAGNDTLLGGRGDDTIHGGRGNDIMTGNQGIDRFVIELLSGTDRVTDFALNVDKIVFGASSGVDSFSDLTITKVGSDAVITWATGDSIRLEGVKASALDADDFEFVGSIAAAAFDTAGARSAAGLDMSAGIEPTLDGYLF